MKDSLSTNIKTESSDTNDPKMAVKGALLNSKFFKKISPKPIIEQVLGKFWVPSNALKNITHVNSPNYNLV